MYHFYSLFLQDEGNSFAFNCSSIHRQKIDEQMELFYCRELVDQSSHVGAIDFSHQDGGFLVSVGGDQIVRLWSLKNNLNPMNRIALPIEMSTKQGSVVVSLTMSPDSRMFYVTLNK